MLATPSPVVGTRGHSCECACVGCERNQTGDFGQRAALDGNRQAAESFCPQVQRFLGEVAAERSKKRRVPRAAHRRRPA
jgi:hypothetical protein